MVLNEDPLVLRESMPIVIILAAIEVGSAPPLGRSERELIEVASAAGPIGIAARVRVRVAHAEKTGAATRTAPNGRLSNGAAAGIVTPRQKPDSFVRGSPRSTQTINEAC